MENKVITEYTKNMEIEGISLRAELKSYEEPVRKSEIQNCFTRLEIFDGENLWGHMNYSGSVENQDEADLIFSSVTKNPKVFKS